MKISKNYLVISYILRQAIINDINKNCTHEITVSWLASDKAVIPNYMYMYRKWIFQNRGRGLLVALAAREDTVNLNCKKVCYIHTAPEKIYKNKLKFGKTILICYIFASEKM